MCKWGTNKEVEVTIVADLSCTGKEKRKVIKVDACIADLVEALDKGGVKMTASCCGHGKAKGVIILNDGRNLIIEKLKDIPNEFWLLYDIEKCLYEEIY